MTTRCDDSLVQTQGLCFLAGCSTAPVERCHNCWQASNWTQALEGPLRLNYTLAYCIKHVISYMLPHILIYAFDTTISNGHKAFISCFTHWPWFTYWVFCWQQNILKQHGGIFFFFLKLACSRKTSYWFKKCKKEKWKKDGLMYSTQKWLRTAICRVLNPQSYQSEVCNSLSDVCVWRGGGVLTCGTALVFHHL